VIVFIFVYIFATTTKGDIDMLDLLREILKSDAGSFGFVFAVCGAICYSIYYITKFATKIDTEHGLFSKRIDKIEDNTDKIKENIILIKAAMKIPLSDSYTQSQSPVTLNPKGREIARRLGIEKMVASNWEHIFQYIEKSVKDKNAYDIQQFCIERATVNLLEFFTEEDVRAIKSVAFNEGRTVESFGSLIGVIIRDAYFEKKGILVDEVDKNDPLNPT
jgi:hypothetical protein